MNTSFAQDVRAFLNKYKINNVKTLSPDQVKTLDRDKIGIFDFESESALPFGLLNSSAKFVSPRTATITSITACWCPFLSGGKEVGFVDIPEHVNFVFTMGMQGCALVVSRNSEGKLRVWHNQHPADKNKQASDTDKHIASNSRSVYSDKLMHSEYASALPDGGGRVANAFVGMHRKDGVWYYFAQANELMPNLTLKTARDQPVVYREINLTTIDPAI